MSGGAAPLLVVAGFTRRYPGVTALDAVDLRVAPGEVVALLGENGAGKSTLVELVAGTLRPDGGTMELEGAAFAPDDPRAAWARGVAAVHQHLHLVEAFTVGENLELALPAPRRRELARRWRELGAGLDLELPRLDAPVAGLGIGQRQWVEVGLALLVEPRLLLLDEPTAVLTPREAEALFATVRRLAAGGTGVLFITHRLDEVQQVADRVVVLRRGRVAAELGARVPSRALAEAMVGELVPPVEAVPARPGPVVARLVEVAAPPRLAPLDLALRVGELVVLAGVDGNGQSEAAERLAGLAEGPGWLELDGRRLARPHPADLRRRGVWVVPADRTREGLLPGLTVAENLVLGRHRDAPFIRHGLLRPEEIRRAASRLIKELQVAGRPSQPAGGLSGGNQQKLLVGRALAARPRVLVAIHPTRGLDVAAQRTVRRLLLEARATGVAVLVVTADLDEARTLGDRILVLSRGRVVGEGDRSTPLERLAQWVGGEAA